jgi:hypothetical protein
MKRWSPFLVCAVMALIPLAVHAASAVRIHASWQSSDSSSAARTVQLDVRNISSGELRNVDLRLAPPSSASLVKGVVQVGTVPAGQARVATAQVVFRSGATPLVWSVDYDDAAGHHTAVVAAIPPGQ